MDDEQPMIDPQDRHTYEPFCWLCQRTLDGGNHVVIDHEAEIISAAKAWGEATRGRSNAFSTPTYLDAQDVEYSAACALFALVDPGEGT